MKQFLITLLLAFAMLGALAAPGETAENITKECAITIGDTRYKPSAALDGNLKESWKYSYSKDFIKVVIPEGIVPGGYQVEWFKEPESYRMIQYNAAGEIIAETTLEDHFLNICTYFELNQDTRTIKLFAAVGTRIANMSVYSAGTLPESVQVWQKPVEKANIMLISTHQDDEVLWFGGAIPYYNTVMDKDMIVVYMTTCGRLRRGEALNGLWVMGVRTYPEFLNMKDKRINSWSKSVELWGGKKKTVGALVETIRKYKPEVILTHDISGEYGHMQHKITSEFVLDAIEAAADSEMYSESYELYGAWQVKKLYRHLGNKNVIYMNWNTPAEALGGLTPLESATLGFKQHRSQQSTYDMSWGVKYDNTKFSLVYTVVGEDVYKDDFLENTIASLRMTTR